MDTEHVSLLLYRTFNISRYEVSRVVQAWLLHFCYALAFFLGWTVLLALFIGTYHAEHLPYLFMAYALCSVVGSFLYSSVIYRVSLKRLMLITTALLLLFLGGAMLLMQQEALFFMLLFIVFGIFIFQISILLARHREELFTPLESQRVLPLIDTTEPIGGIAAGLIILILVEKIHTETFLYGVAALFVLLLGLFLILDRSKHKVPRLKKETEELSQSRMLTLKRGMEHLRAIPFMRGMAWLVLFWIMALYMVDILYTRTIEELVTHGAHDVAHAGGLKGLLSERLGSFQILFSSLVLLMQLFFSSRLSHRLGVIKSFFLMPCLSLLPTVGAILQGGLVFPVGLKASMETWGVVHRTAYHNAYYSVPENMREYIRQLLEGIIRPAGIVLSMMLILIAQFLFAHSAPFYLYVLVGLLLFGMLVIVSRFPGQYTAILKKNLASNDLLLKTNTIEILSQKSSREASEILSKALLYRTETPPIKCKLIRALGTLKDPNALPEILQSLHDPHMDVRIEACHALAQYQHLGQQVYHHAFSRHKIVTTLTAMFTEENSKHLRSAIIRVFANMQHGDIAPLLIRILEKSRDDGVVSDCIAIIGQFDDINIWHYVSPYLSSASPRVKANAIIALWKFKKYRLQLLIHLLSLLENKERDALLSGLYAVGEINAIQELPRLQRHLQSADPNILRHTAMALLKMNQPEVIPVVLALVLEHDDHTAQKTLAMLRNIPTRTAQAAYKTLQLEASHYLRLLMQEHHLHMHHLVDVSTAILLQLQHLYRILGEDQEVMEIHAILEQRSRPMVEKKQVA